MVSTRSAVARKRKHCWLVRFRFRSTDSIRWVTEVGQVTATKTEDARANVIKMHGKEHHHPFDWFTEWPPAFESTDATLHTLLVARGWRTEYGQWLGRAKGRKERGQGKNAATRGGAMADVYKELVNAPDTHIEGIYR